VRVSDSLNSGFNSEGSMAVKSSGGGGKGGSIRAGKAHVELNADDSGLRTGLMRAKQMVLKFGQTMAKAGAVMFGAGGTLLGGIGASFGLAVDHFDKVKKAADRLGTSAEIISGLGYAAEQSGSSLEGLEAALKANQKALVNNADGFKEIGLSAEELMKMPLDQRLMAQADALAAIGNDAVRAEKAMEIFGRAGAGLLPLMKDGGRGIKDLVKEAGKVGSVVSSTDAANAERMGDALSRTWTAAKNTFMAVGAALLPQIDRVEMLSSAVVQGIGIVRGWINENRELITIVTAAAGVVAGIGVALMALGGAMAVASLAIGGLVTFGSTVVAWAPTIGIIAGVAAAIAGLGYILYEFTSAGDVARGMFAELGKVAAWAGGVLKTAWSGISAALKNGDLKGGLGIAGQAIQVFWARVELEATKVWHKVKRVAVDAWHDIMGSAAKGLVDFDTQFKLIGADWKGWFKGIWASVWDMFAAAAAVSTKLAIDGFRDLFKFAIANATKTTQYIVDAFKNPGKATAPVLDSSPALAGADRAGTQAAIGDAMAGAMGKDQAKEAIRIEGERLKAEIDALTEAKKKAGAEADAAAIERLIVKLKQEEAKLQKMTNDQKMILFGGIAGQMALIGMMVPNFQEKKAAAIAGMASSTVRGQFGGMDIQARMGIGGARIEEKQLDQMQEMNKKLGKIEQKVGGLMVD
jgi:hypothetical protein